MSDEITQQIYSILCENAPKPPGKIDDDTELSSIGLGSLEVVETVFDLEEKFDITIPNPGESDEINTNFRNVGDVVSAVKILIELET
ncbi:MAG: acyl carrier protein [Pseudomonadales bacterium]|nr:acyl carrier protein [Pseudomonadales bacterium]